MTDKELQKLNRAELLEMLLIQSKKIKKLENDIEDLNAKLEDKRIKIKDSGSMAEAAMKLNEVFEAADKAAAQYLDNAARNAKIQNNIAQKKLEQAEMLLTEAKRRCEEMENDTKHKCDSMLRRARIKAMSSDAYGWQGSAEEAN